ncbi:hypothetical protein C1J05_12705 [Sulfitobacter sp. JL08]|nr:hypothetical protein C1J05_12705 [Sulfitobacter sp. JL08]
MKGTVPAFRLPKGIGANADLRTRRAFVCNESTSKPLPICVDSRKIRASFSQINQKRRFLRNKPKEKCVPATFFVRFAC